MKKAAVAFALVVASASSLASVMGFLVSSEVVTTVTGKLAYKCTYNVMGSNTTVMLTSICPPSMNFD